MSQLARVRCTLCGEWVITSGITSSDLALGFKCPECLDIIEETRRWIADEADTDEQPTLIPSAQNAQPLHPARPADEWADCEAEPVPGETYCAIAYLVSREHNDFVFTPAGVPVVCDAHFVELHKQMHDKYRDRALDASLIAGLTNIMAERYIKAARKQVARAATRHSL